MRSSLRGNLIRVAYEDESIRGLILPLVETKVASDSADLEKRVIRLAYLRPELRTKLLPVLIQGRSKEAFSTSDGDLIEFYGKDKDTPVEGAKGGKLKIQTVLDYAKDKSHPAYKASQAFLKTLADQMEKHKVKEKVKGGAKATAEASKKALGAGAKMGGSLIKKAMGGLGKKLEGAGDSIMKRYGPVDGAVELGGAVLKAGFGAAMDALKDDSGNFESIPSKRQTNMMNLDTGVVTRHTVERQKSFGGRMANGLKRVAKAGALATLSVGAGVAGAAVGATVGAGMKVLGGVAKLAGKGLSSAGKKASEAYNPEEMEAALAEFFTMPEELEKQIQEQAIGEDGIFDQDKFEELVEAHFKKSEEEFEAHISKIIEEHGGSEEDVEKAKEEVKEEAKEEAKEEVKKQTAEAFISKKALVRTAYENPKCRKQLLSLIQDGGSRFPASQVRLALQG